MHWKIGAFSRFTRVSVKMLRHYDELGLLRPAAVDPESGYRYYLTDQISRLNRILALKDLGFTLEQVAALLDGALSTSDIQAMLARRRAEIVERIQAEEQRLAQVDARLHSLADQSVAGYDVVLRPIAPLLVATIRAVVPEGDEPIAAIFDEVETYVATHAARAASSPLMLMHDAAEREGGLTIEVAVPLTRPIPPGGRVAVRELPSVPNAACVVYHGSYNQTVEALRALVRWVDANGYRADGPLREVYLRFGADGGAAYRIPPVFLGSASDEYVTEVQLPVARSRIGHPGSAPTEI
jgi:DNA-binding transcriptional MerR regulator